MFGVSSARAPTQARRAPGGHEQGSYLSSPLQVCEVNIRDEEHGLRVQVGHGFEVGDVTLLL